MVRIFQTGQKTAGAHFDQRFGVGVSRRSHRRTDYNDDSRLPSEVLLTKADGMPRDCAINFDHLQTVSKGKIGSLIATLSSNKMQEMRAGVLFALGF